MKNPKISSVLGTQLLFAVLVGMTSACALQHVQQESQGASESKLEENCLDIRAALVRCKEGEVLTHEGCPEPAYMQRCAVKPAK